MFEDEYPAIGISWESDRTRNTIIKSELLCMAEYDPDRSPGHEVCVMAYQAHEEEPMYCKSFLVEEKESYRSKKADRKS